MSMLLDSPAASLPVVDRLCDGLKALHGAAGVSLPVLGIGVLLWDGPNRVVLSYADATGATAHRLPSAGLPEVARPGHPSPGRFASSDDGGSPLGVLGMRVLLEGLPESVRAALPVRQASTFPIPGAIPATLIMGVSTADQPTDRQLVTIGSFANDVANLLNGTETSDDELVRLRRLQTVEGVMPALISVLDIREIFVNLSAVTQEGLPHDLLSVGTFSDDLKEVYTYASAGTGIPDKAPVPYPREVIEAFLYQVLDDMGSSPIDTSAEGKEAGIRAAMRLPVRLEDRTVAVLNFSSNQRAQYGSVDLAVGRRIADYVALAMSHQRLADEARRASALQERASNLEMLDGLLNTITGVLDIREVFDRVSEIARRVLPHDMLALPLNAGNGSVLVYAVAGGIALPSPQLIPLAEPHRALFKGHWEHIIYDDVQADPFEREQPPGQAGYRSLLRVAIRLEGRLAGVLDFASTTPSFYTNADAVIGRRIADHVALVLSHQRLAEETLKAASLEARSANLQMLDSLLSAITGVLHIREVFVRVSEIASKVLPHDAMSLPIFTDDRQHVIPYATTFPDGVLPQIIPLPESQQRLVTEHWDSHIADDIHMHPDGVNTPMARVGMHSLLRVPIRLEGELVGMLAFFSKQIGAYTQDDALLAKRIASHVALVVSHQRLADESQRRAALQERQANLEMLDGLLKTLTGVLDIREVFDRVSDIAQRVLPHDAVAIGEVIAGGESIRMYASQGLGLGPRPFETPIRDRSLLTEPWDFRLFDDIGEHPHYSNSNSATVAGMRSVLFVPIRLDEGRLYGALTFYARARGRFTRDDVLIAKRIADHIVLALQHERLAEEMRQSEELRSRTANLGLLDALLAAVTDTGELRTVIDRVSEIAQKVLPHDAMVVPVLLGDKANVRFHVVRAPGTTFPEVMETAPHLRNSEWEYDISEDLQADPAQRELTLAKLGYRAVLRMPIRVEGQLTAGVGFFSFTPGAYKQADVAIGRRVADRIAISLMRELGVQASKRADEAAARAQRLESRVQALTDELNSRSGFHRVIGKSASWRQVLTQASQVAATETTVLLLGESGTGKEVVARFLHRASTRKNGPFVALNCAALPEQLLESELFGYERGAFTGAMVSRAGKIEQAAGGVLFLDEVGEMSPPVQAKFLRVLQEREFQRLGGAKTLKADARVIAATNRDPKAAMERGQFREDLYYRLSVFEISLPPLRERRDDILLLVESFLSDLAKSVGRPAAGLSEDAKDRLLGYSWPGNVRELRNAIERAVILCEGGLISSEHLPIAIGQARTVPVAATAITTAAAAASPGSGDATGASTSPGGLKLDDLERDLLNKAMAQARNNKSQAAKLLGVPRGQFYSLLKKHGLTDAKR
jgi:transcriptional regulator with GAF, ATPase, and Fis domain